MNKATSAVSKQEQALTQAQKDAQAKQKARQAELEKQKKELAKKQDYLKAYFKGGTAVYKILENMNRFSEDIDLTVKVLPEESNTRNKKRLKESKNN